MVPILSPHRPCHSHIIPIIPTLSPSSPQGPHVVPTSQWLCSLLSPPHIVPVVPKSSLSSPHFPHITYKVPTSYSTPQIAARPTPTSKGVGPRISKNSIRFELIKKFSVWKFEICEDSPTYGWVPGLVGGWMGGLMGGARSNH